MASLITGRRNIRKFVETAKQIGLKVLSESGLGIMGMPERWTPGLGARRNGGAEGRNTNSTTCGTLRSVDPAWCGDRRWNGGIQPPDAYVPRGHALDAHSRRWRGQRRKLLHVSRRQ